MDHMKKSMPPWMNKGKTDTPSKGKSTGKPPADDKAFGGKPGAAQKAYASMVSQHGQKKADQVYAQTLAKKKAAMSKKPGLKAAMARTKPGKSVPPWMAKGASGKSVS